MTPVTTWTLFKAEAISKSSPEDRGVLSQRAGDDRSFDLLSLGSVVLPDTLGCSESNHWQTVSFKNKPIQAVSLIGCLLGAGSGTEQGSASCSHLRALLLSSPTSDEALIPPSQPRLSPCHSPHPASASNPVPAECLVLNTVSGPECSVLSTLLVICVRSLHSTEITSAICCQELRTSWLETSGRPRYRDVPK